MLQEPRPSLAHQFTYRMADILWHRHYEAGMLFSSLIWFGVALALANPFANTFASSPSFQYLADVMDEKYWAILIGVLSINQFFAMLSWNRIWRIHASGFMSAIGLWVGISIGFANPNGTGIAVYLGLAAMGLWTFARSWRGVV